jgi:hypothetical protein
MAKSGAARGFAAPDATGLHGSKEERPVSGKPFPRLANSPGFATLPALSLRQPQAFPVLTESKWELQVVDLSRFRTVKLTLLLRETF